MAITRRQLFRLLPWAVSHRLAAAGKTASRATGRRVVLVTIGGIRRQESFSERGVVHIPRLFGDMLPKSLFYPYTANEGVTSHFNTISSILTGVWQHVDDWGSEKPSHPTVFHYLQQQKSAGPDQTWVVTSNKQLTANISPGVNVILSKQLMVEAVERIITGMSSRNRLEREQILQEMTAVLNSDYERIGWGVPSKSSFQDAAVREAFVSALASFINGPDAPASGDELTFLIAREVLQRVAPAVLMINFSDVEVAHSGAYSLHLGGIRRTDRLCHQLWRFIEDTPALASNTTLVIMNEFGRDPDGSGTNGFFNHRTNTESCRMAWTMVLGQAVRKPEIVEKPIRQVDMAPSIGSWLGFDCTKSAGVVLPQFHG